MYLELIITDFKPLSKSKRLISTQDPETTDHKIYRGNSLYYRLSESAL